jgi:hypothetical protein
VYLQRRHGHHWFRKATPLDLIHVLGQAEVRCSLRTDRRDVAKRRARALLVALDNVYAVLGSEEPLEPAKILLGNFAQDFVKHVAGTPEGIQVAYLQLQRATDIVGAPALPPDNQHDRAWVNVDDVEPLLAREQPRTDANAAATELLRLAIRMRRERSRSRVERSKALIVLCQKNSGCGE